MRHGYWRLNKEMGKYFPFLHISKVSTQNKVQVPCLAPTLDGVLLTREMGHQLTPETTVSYLCLCCVHYWGTVSTLLLVLMCPSRLSSCILSFKIYPSFPFLWTCTAFYASLYLDTYHIKQILCLGAHLPHPSRL